jgi:hypothetical protein
MLHRWFVALGMIVAAASTSPAQTVSITACGQTVPAGQAGVVEADLACPTDIGTFAVRVEKQGSLDLAGHTLVGGNAGVRCLDRCTVTSSGGPGTVRDSGTAGIAVVSEGVGRLTVSNVILENNEFCILTDFLRGKVTGEQVTLTDCGLGIQARKILITGLTASGTYTVAQARRTMLRDSTVSASTGTAFTGKAVTLTNSTVTGSASGVDLLTDRRPRLVNSTCEVSRKLSQPTETWGVCAND